MYWLFGKFPFALNAKTNLYEQPEAASHYLAKLAQLNGKAFTAAPLSRDYTLSEKMTLSAGKNNMAELVKAGADDAKLSTAVFDGLLHELAESKTYFPLYYSLFMRYCLLTLR